MQNIYIRWHKRDIYIKILWAHTVAIVCTHTVAGTCTHNNGMIKIDISVNGFVVGQLSRALKIAISYARKNYHVRT